MKQASRIDPADCPRCPAEAAIGVLGGRWKARVVWLLLERGTRRFGELHRGLPGVTQKVLTQQLRELEADGVVSRKVYAEVPPKVEYSLTGRGRSLKPVIDAMCKWGKGTRPRGAPKGR
jgi:DNA-binding HxlR family transcriptional regulator